MREQVTRFSTFTNRRMIDPSDGELWILCIHHYVRSSKSKGLSYTTK